MSVQHLEQVDFMEAPDGYRAVRGAVPGYPLVDSIESEALDAALEEGNRHYMIVPDSDGRWHEMTIFNKGQGNRTFKPSTSYSGLRKNPANFQETAVLAAMNPDTEFVYWTSFGNYPTGRLNKRDRAYWRKTGRNTVGDGSEATPYEPTTSIKRLVGLLDKLDLLPQRMYADQEAGRLAIAIGAGLPEASLEHLYLNGLDGLSPNVNYTKDDIINDLKSRVRRRGMGEGEPDQLTPANLKHTQDMAPTIYHGFNRYAHLPPLVLRPLDLIDKASFQYGRHGHNNMDKPEDHAVHQDLLAMFAVQESSVTLRINEKDANDKFEVERFAVDTLNIAAQVVGRRKRCIRILIGHSDPTENTDQPAKSGAAARHATSSPGDRRLQMTALPGGALSLTQIFSIKPIREAA